MSIFESCSSCEKVGSGTILESILLTSQRSGGALGRLFLLFGHRFSHRFCHATKKHTIASNGVLKIEHGGTRARLWRAGKTTHSEESIAKPKGKRTFGKIAQTGAVRKGELLRGMVSQGRPHPLSFALRC